MRTKTPASVSDEAMFASDRTCCICREVKNHPLHIHHIDEDATNQDPENLAVVCMNCHGLVSFTSGMARRFSPGEVRRFKKDWESRVAARRDAVGAEDGEDDVEPDDYATIRVRADEHMVVRVSIEERASVIVKIDSNVALRVFLATARNVARYENDRSYDVLAESEDILEDTLQVAVEDASALSLVLENTEDEDATVEYGIWIVVGE